MKRTDIVGLLCVLLSVSSVPMWADQAAQNDSKDAAKKPAAKPAAQAVTLVGCVEGTGAVGDPFRLTDAKDGFAYRLTGTNMRAFAGKRVQIVGGTDSRRLKIVGGLVPSANAAAQAGAMDPARAVVASDPLVTAGKADQPLPEFRVRSIRSVSGACEK